VKILVTGSKGFIGKNLCLFLLHQGYEVLEYDIGSSEEELTKDIQACDFAIHLAGVNRPSDVKEYKEVNFGLTQKIVQIMMNCGTKAPILLGSSTQATNDTPYGESKAMAESLINNLGFNRHETYVFRFANVFGKWCRPNYNSVVATFCYNIAHDLPIDINEKAPVLDFVYVDDVCQSIIDVIEKRPVTNGHPLFVAPSYSAKPSEIADIIKSFKTSRDNLVLPIQDGFVKKLYATYLSYLPQGSFTYPLTSHSDQRGSFTEMLKTQTYGQVSVNVIKPGAIKGNHYHMSKNEKYLVVSGTCEIKERQIFEDKINTYVCSDKQFEVVDIIPGYTHSIKNIGSEDAIVIMWASDVYDKDHDDTVLAPVEKEGK
jgi:UDP-2-acetamido-2,6-beta-L-arabino-hexul-4-ose reductase